MTQKPKIFLGSSAEGLPLLNDLYIQLEDDFELMLWKNTDFFEPSKYTLECFEDKAADYDFAIFLLHPDDLIISKGVPTLKTRDNVVFEYGLFFSAIGRSNVFLLEPNPKYAKVVFPSDLYGITTIQYDYANDKPKMVGAAIKIKRVIEAQIKRQMAEKSTLQANKQLWPLKIAIISGDHNGVSRLHLELKKYNPQLLTTTIYENYGNAKEAMSKEEIHCVFIDIFSLDTRQGIDLISYARDRHRNIGFAIYGKSKDLYTLPMVEEFWRSTLQHFWKLQMDANNESFRISVEDIIVMFFIYRLSCGYFGEVPGSIVKNIFQPNVIGAIKEWHKYWTLTY